MTLKEFNTNRNKVLFWHKLGGLGDVIMHRMIFSDVKKQFPDIDIYFACFPEYFDVVNDHPDIKQVLDSRNINLKDFGIHYNTCVTIADRYESMKAPNYSDHRSDIWAKYCGVKLNSHDINFIPDKVTLKKCKKRLEELRSNEKPLILLAPVSKMATKCLLPNQINCIKEYLKDYNLLAIHNKEIKELKGIYNASLKEWMHYIYLSDYVISVDTAAFHFAGSIGKPLTGIFTFADGKIYGKYFNFELVQKHRDNGNWNCGPCFKYADCPLCHKQLKPCLTEITEDELLTGIKNMINKWKID